MWWRYCDCVAKTCMQWRHLKERVNGPAATMALLLDFAGPVWKALGESWNLFVCREVVNYFFFLFLFLEFFFRKMKDTTGMNFKTNRLCAPPPKTGYTSARSRNILQYPPNIPFTYVALSFCPHIHPSTISYPWSKDIHSQLHYVKHHIILSYI